MPPQARQKFWTVWKEQDTDFLKDALARYIHDRIPTEQDRNLISLFTPARVMELIRYFVLFDANVKKSAAISSILPSRRLSKPSSSLMKKATGKAASSGIRKAAARA